MTEFFNLHPEGTSPDATALPTPFIRAGELDDIRNAIDVEDCYAVIIRYDTGLGASSVLRQMARESSPGRAVLTLHGTPSLESIPYGVLAPYVRQLEGDDVGLRTNVLRAVLGAFTKTRPGDHTKTQIPLFLVDDAHAVDPSTAELLLTLVLSGTAKLVATHRRNQNLPEPLKQLWRTGNAESIELLPLNRETCDSYCQALLSGPVDHAASWHFWVRSEGNPMLLRLLVAEALEDGLLTRNRGVWNYTEGRHPVGPDLRDAVRRQIRGLSEAAREALDIVALAEPVALSIVESACGKGAVEELVGRELIGHLVVDDGLLRLASPIYGEVIRQLVLPAQRRILYDNLLEKLQSEPTVSEALVRRVSWAVDVGLPVSPDLLVNAALTACKVSQPNSALELLSHVPAQEATFRARAIEARAHHVLGDSGKVAELLDVGFEGVPLDELLLGALLQTVTKMAVGFPTDSVEKDIDRFLASGRQLAERMPDQSVSVLEHVAQKEKLLRLLVLSRTGNYAAMTPLIDSILAGSGLVTGEDHVLNKAFALTVDAERLCAMGRTSQSQARAAEAMALELAGQYDVFFVTETIIFRQLTTGLCSGDLALVAGLMEQFIVDVGAVSVTFGGWPDIARGMGLLRQGLTAEALEVLLPGLEALRVSDPQQVLAFGLAMAAYAAAKLDQVDLARSLIAEHREQPAIFLVAAHTKAYLAGAREYIHRDGKGLAVLVEMAGDFQAQGLPLLELNALVLAVELGEKSLVGRLLEVAPTIDGPWAEAVSHFGQDQATNRPRAVAVRFPGEILEGSPRTGAQLPLANPVFSSRKSPLGLQMVPPGNAMPVPVPVEADITYSRTAHLTPREREIAELAVQGLSDRAIATKLSLSTRTVEGHLYRAYAKLGIAGREDLTADLFR